MKSVGIVVDSKGRRADYSSLCERVNQLGTTLAVIKKEFEQLNNEKKVKAFEFDLIDNFCIVGDCEYY